MSESYYFVKQILEDIRKVRNDLVAQSNPHFQDLTNIIYKWETKLVEETPEYKLKTFEERACIKIVCKNVENNTLHRNT